MSDSKDSKPDRIIDAEAVPVSPEEAARTDSPEAPPRVDLRGAVPKSGAAAGGQDGQKPPASGPAFGGDRKPGADKTTGADRASSSAQATGTPPPADAPPPRPSAGGKAGSGGGGSRADAPGGSGSGGSGSGGVGSSGSVPRRPAGRGTIMALVAAVVILLALVIGLVGGPLLAPWLPQALGVSPPALRVEAQLGDMQDRLTAMVASLAESRRAAEAATEQAGQVPDLRRTLDELQRRMQALGGLTGQMEQLDRQVRAVAQPDATLTGRLDGLEKLAGEVGQRLDGLEARSGPDPALQQRLDTNATELAAVSRLTDSIQRRMDGMDNAVNSSRGQVEALERRIGAMDDRIAAAARPSAQVTDAIDGLQQRLAGLERDLAAAGTRIDALQSLLQQNQVTSQAAEDRESGRSRWALLFLTLRQIEGSLATGAPFAREVATLPDLLGQHLAADAGVQAALATLRDHGQSGVASVEALQSSFGAAVSQALRDRPASGPEPGIWDRIVDGAAGLVTIRPVGDVAGDSAGAILARAETALSARDLPRAVAEVEKLSGASEGAMAAWLGQARDRLAVIAALDRLGDGVAGTLAPEPAAVEPAQPRAPSVSGGSGPAAAAPPPTGPVPAEAVQAEPSGSPAAAPPTAEGGAAGGPSPDPAPVPATDAPVSPLPVEPAPPGTAPPGTAPPGTAPPGTAPPGTDGADAGTGPAADDGASGPRQ